MYVCKLPPNIRIRVQTIYLPYINKLIPYSDELYKTLSVTLIDTPQV